VSTSQFFAPESVSEAVGILASHDEARPIAGGTDLVVAARNGKQPLPSTLVALHRIVELRSLEAEDEGLRIGAHVTHGELASSADVVAGWTALADASLLVGSPATRNTGTIGGNVINASPALELGAPLLVHRARVRLKSEAGERTLGVNELWLGPGRTAAAPHELLTEVAMPRAPAGSGSAYVRLEYRQAMEIAIVGAAALVTVEDGCIAEAALALTAVAPTCVLVEGVADILAGSTLESAPLELAVARAVEQAAPISDLRASAVYRRAQVGVMAARALRIALRRASGETVGVPANRWADFGS